MMSDYLLVLHRETPVQNRMINFNKGGQIYDINCTNNPLQQAHSLSIPGFSYLRNVHNIPLHETVNNTDPSFSTHITNKRQLPYDEQNRPKFQRLEKEAADFCAKLIAVDVLDSDQFQPIKNDVRLSATLENNIINNSVDTDEDDQEIDVGDESSSFSIGKSADLPQASSEIPNSSSLEVTGRSTESVLGSVEQDNPTIAQNLVNAERTLITSNHFSVLGRERSEYSSPYEAYSFSHFFVNSAEFEPKFCVSTSVPTLRGKTVNTQDLISPTVCVPAANEIGSNFAMFYETKDRNVSMHIDHDQPYDFQRLIENVTPVDNSDLKDDGVTQSQESLETENISVKHERKPLLDDMVHNLELLHNQENDLMDELNLRNWLSSFVEQEEEAENLSNNKEIPSNLNAENMSGVTVGCHENTTHEKNVSSSLLLKQESSNDFLAGNQDKTVSKEFPSDSIQVGDIYADKTKNCTEDNFTRRFLQCLFPDVADISPVQKAEESTSRESTLQENDVLTNLTTVTVDKDTNNEVTSTSLQHCENKPRSEADTNAISSTKSVLQTTDSHCKHHKKELLRKFSSALEKEKNNSDLSVSSVNVEQTEANLVDETLPSTSSLANEDKLAEDCIVISDSEDSIIECEIVHTRTKANKVKRSSKIIATNLSNSDSTQPLGVESSTEQQEGSSTPTIGNITECIVLSDDEDDDQLPQNTLSPDSPVFVNDRSLRNRPDTLGVIDLSGSSRNQHEILKENDAVNVERINNVIGSIAFAATRFGTHSVTGTDFSVMDMQRNSSFAQNFFDTVSGTFNTTEGNFGGELDDDNVIDLSRRSFSPLSSESEIDSVDGLSIILDLSGSERKQNEENASTKRNSDEEPSEKQIKDETGNYSARSCPICLDSLLSGQSISTTPCGHLFCTTCIETAVNQFRKCPTCCRKVLLKRVHKIFL